MELTINGEKKDIKSTTVQDMLLELGLEPLITVVEKNMEIINRPEYAATALQEGDVLELVRFMGGGCL